MVAMIAHPFGVMQLVRVLALSYEALFSLSFAQNLLFLVKILNFGCLKNSFMNNRAIIILTFRFEWYYGSKFIKFYLYALVTFFVLI